MNTLDKTKMKNILIGIFNRLIACFKLDKVIFRLVIILFFSTNLSDLYGRVGLGFSYSGAFNLSRFHKLLNYDSFNKTYFTVSDIAISMIYNDYQMSGGLSYGLLGPLPHEIIDVYLVGRKYNISEDLPLLSSLPSTVRISPSLKYVKDLSFTHYEQTANQFLSIGLNLYSTKIEKLQPYIGIELPISKKAGDFLSINFGAEFYLMTSNKEFEDF